MADETCRAFNKVGTLDRTVIHRFVIGENSAPEPMSSEAAAAELGDPFATLLLLRGIFPRTPAELLAEITRATDETDPLRDEMVFLLGEGSQIEPSAVAAQLDRGLRFLIARGQKTDPGPDLLLSAPHPNRGFAEVMAWDRRSAGFNYYRSVGPNTAWVWAGNSRHALSEPTRGKGPFESHVSGNFLMKELERPWVHWDSFDVHIREEMFPEEERAELRPWLDGVSQTPLGAAACEVCVAKPGIRRWTNARFDQMRQDGSGDGAKRVLEQILRTATVNLRSSLRRSRESADADEIELPDTFFVDSDALTRVLGLAAPPARNVDGKPKAPFAVSGQAYATALETFEVALKDDDGFAQPGDTFFAFVVPERAFEDTFVLEAAVVRGILPQDLAAALLMVDFPNPIFSDRRVSLLTHLPDGATLDDFAERLETNILKAAESAPEGSAEREFAQLRAAGENWQSEFNALLTAYYRAVTTRLATQEGFNEIFRLAEARRNRVRDRPIFENPLLLAHTNVPRDLRALAMTPDAQVVAAGGSE